MEMMQKQHGAIDLSRSSRVGKVEENAQRTMSD